MQEVSREFKSTLEKEIGLDEIQTSNQNTYRPNTTNTTSNPSPNSSSEGYDPSESLTIPHLMMDCVDYLFSP